MRAIILLVVHPYCDNCRHRLFKIFHDSHLLTHQIQTFPQRLPLSKSLISQSQLMPESRHPHIISGSPSPPDGIQVGTYKIVAIINAQPISATFQVTNLLLDIVYQPSPLDHNWLVWRTALSFKDTLL